MNGKLVSVIVPVYKVENYLRACVESITSQTYKNIEIILVDDKSPDKSGAICDELAKNDGRIRVIHKAKNEGLNMARKTGYDASNGKYITFLDGDDFFDTKNVEQSLRALHDHKADVAIYGFKEFSDADKKEGILFSDVKPKLKPLITKEQIAKYVFHGGDNLPGVQYITVWGKLYTRKVVESVDWGMANYRAYEDNFWTPQALLASAKIVLMSSPLIYYRRNVAYGTNGTNLGNKLTGNTINGQPVGYLEFVELVRKFYSKLARENGLNPKLDKQTNRQLFLIKTWRVDNLAKAGLLDAENNMEFVLPFLREYIVAKNEHINNLETAVAHLNHLLEERDATVAHLNHTLNELQGVNRSVKLTVGNIKRKFIKPKD